MSEVPPSQDESDDVDDLYRRASALDPSRPSESARRAVLDHAAKLAAERAARNDPAKTHFARGAANQTWRRPAIFGTLAAAALAGLLVAPHFLPPSTSTGTAPSTSTVTSTGTAPIKAVSPTQDSPPKMATMPGSHPSPAAGQGVTEPRASARNAVPIAGSAAESAAKGAPAEVQSKVSAQSTAPASSDRETDARRTQIAAPTAPATSAPPSRTAAAMASAARLSGPARDLRQAAENGDLTELQGLLDKQPDIDARDASGRTALMLATLHGQTHAVDVLLAHGADPNAADARGITPLQAAVAGNFPAIVAALQRGGAR